MQILLFFSFLIGIAGHSADRAEVHMQGGRVEIQFSIPSNQSQGAFELRNILLAHNFENDEGIVDTKEELYPLKLYNYLYEDGTFVFSIILPPDDSDLSVTFSGVKFIAFNGLAAQKLFQIVKQHRPRYDFEGSTIEQYRWGTEENVNYCDKTKEAPIEYRCFINL